jgi:hypothetical protein
MHKDLNALARKIASDHNISMGDALLIIAQVIEIANTEYNTK